MQVSFFFVWVIGVMFSQKGAYGRYTTENMGLLLDGRIDWYLHGISLIAVYYFMTLEDVQGGNFFLNKVMMIPFIIHYINRSFIHVLRMSMVKPIPASVLASSFSFVAINSSLITREVTKHKSYDAAYFTSPQCVFGFLIWAFGFFGNIYHDRILIELKNKSLSKETGGSKKLNDLVKVKSYYRIPYGGFFNYVSGANFLMEIIEWIGFAIQADFPISTITFVWCSFCFIGGRAAQHHEWYLNHFGDEYASLNRKRLIPFVW